MKLTNYTVNFLGNQQTPITRAYIDELVRTLTPRVPAESSFVLNIIENGEKVIADFKIISTMIRFESNKKARTAVDVMDLILEDISGQIDFWIEKRVV